MIVYSGINTYPSELQLPAAGDLADAVQLTQAAKDLADRTTFLSARISAHSAVHNPIVVETTDGDNITVKPFYGVGVYDTAARTLVLPADITLTAADIDGGGARAGNKTYYLYAYWNGTQTKVMLSVAVPDAFRVFRAGSTSHALIGMVQTTAAAKWKKMRLANRIVCLYEEEQVQGFIASAAAPTPIPLATRVPDIADTVCLCITGLSNVAVPSPVVPWVAVAPDGISPLVHRKLELSPPLESKADLEIANMPMVASRKLQFLTNSTTTLFSARLRGWTF